MTMKFSGVFDTGPVTALAACDNYILAGVGGSVTVYNSLERRKLSCRDVLPNRNIHGIRKKFDENTFCIFGEKCFRIISLHIDDKKVVVEWQGDAAVIEDWILDVVWLKECESGPYTTLALALSHNVVVLWDPHTSSQLHRVCCVENCILYCAHFTGATWSELVLAAGTVFNKVIIWSPGGDTSSQQQRDIIHTLSGHQGVIFSIDYFPSKHIIASVSDDRTIRLWSLSFPGDGETVSDWRRVESSPLLTLYGHSARVWDVELLDTVLVSVAEDATCLVWDYTGKILHKFRGHKGKSIWSLACDKNEEFVVTGGGDGSVRMWTLEEDGGQGDTVHRTLSLPDERQDEEDFARTVAMSDIDTVLVMTNCGCLLKYNMMSASWSQISHDPLFSSYTVMAVSPRGKYVAIGNITGIVKVFDVSSCEETSVRQLYDGKVFGLVWADTGHLLTTGPEGHMLVISVQDLKTRARLTLPVCKQRWASAGVLCRSEGVSVNVLVCGDRGGTVHCYNILDDSSAEPHLPVSSYGKIHGKAGVTDVCYHDNRVYTSGRDGRYRQWEMSDTGLQLRTTHRVMKGMDWVDRVCVSDEDTLIYGFHSSHFTLWSVGENLRLLDVECGGGHRAWDCRLDAGRARFVYLKTKNIAVCDTTCRSRQVILKESLHGRELRDVKHLTTYSNSTGGVGHLVATCSEDTAVQLSTIYSTSPGLTELRVEHTLQGHLSTVKTLALSGSLSQAHSQVGGSHRQGVHGEDDGEGIKDQTQDVIMFSGGGRAQIQVWRIQLKRLWLSAVQKDNTLWNNANSKKNSVPENSQACNKDQLSDCIQIEKSTTCDMKDIAHSPENIPHCVGKHSESFEEVSPVLQEVTGNNKELSLEAEVSHNNKALSPEPGVSHNNKALSPEAGVSHNNEELSPEAGVSCNNKELSPEAGVRCMYEHLGSVFLCGERARKGPLQSDPETRFMCLTALCLHDVSPDCSRRLHILVAACSDSYIRIFGFNEDDRTLTLLQQSGYHDNCVLKVAHIIWRSKVIVISGASEGEIAFWDISHLCLLYAENIAKLPSSNERIKKKKSPKKFVETLDSTLKMDFEPVAMVTVHQSGLNSVHCYSCGDGRHLVVSGGDDNCLSVTSICVRETTDKSCVQIERSVRNVQAHAAQITGVRVLSPDCVVSVSIDQRVCVWQITRAEEQPLKMLGCRYIHISDISSMDAWRDGCNVYLYVCGQGLSVIKLDTS